MLTRLLALAVVVTLAGCSGGGTSSQVPYSNASRAAHDTGSALPGDTGSALPGDTGSALPGDTGSALPGDTGSALPGNVATVCSAVSQTGQARCLAQQNLDILPVPNAQADPLTIKGYQPKDLQAAYRLPAGQPGQTIAVVDAFDNPAVEADLAIYRATFGLPPCTIANGCFQKVNQQGQPANFPAANTAWGKEIALDVEMISATCPNCRIVLVEANSASVDDLGASVDRAVALGATVVSNSYAASEWSGEVAEEQHYNHPGIAQTVSSGDEGIGATYPASSQYVTAVGGTVLTGTSGAYSESGWKYSGRGCSQYIAKPHWQAGWYCKTRATVDVAAIADPGSGVAVYDTFVDSGQIGGWVVLGGTSVGAPIIAAAYALAGDFGTQSDASRLYRRWTMLHDVPPAGWDYVTGLGSPNGVGAF
ncbi:MAG: peptidase S8 [Vulcanimicrobiaceae bacterium]